MRSGGGGRGRRAYAIQHFARGTSHHFTSGLHTKSYLQEAKDCIQSIYGKQRTAYTIIFTGSKGLHTKVTGKKSTAYLAFLVGKDYIQNHIYR